MSSFSDFYGGQEENEGAELERLAAKPLASLSAEERRRLAQLQAAAMPFSVGSNHKKDANPGSNPGANDRAARTRQGNKPRDSR